jgi:hypothetical protein
MELDAILARLDTSGGSEACHPYIGPRTRKYGSATVGGRNVYVHRYLYCLAVGLPYDFDGVVRHVVCRNPICGNVRHLMHGTQADNARDMVADGTSTRGERHPMVKLSRSQVLEIRAKGEAGIPSRELADQYGIALDHARRIVTRKTWAWLESA